ncbi:MAG: glycosyltransferase family 9 protein [Chitinophagaceae bacterium]|nr:glycosyltransferase family 9 protein [Chitinophagaceae bacterium]
MQKYLVIQTAFIGDVVLATALVEKLAQYYPETEIDFLVRKGNESLLQNNPHLHEVLVWNKKENKIKNLFATLSHIRKNNYDKVINLQRCFATGFLTAFSGAKESIGFDKNPLSFLFSTKIKHVISKENGIKHEVERNNDLIRSFTDDIFNRPKLYPSVNDVSAIEPYTDGPYVTMTPGTVWFTKQYPVEKWIELISNFPKGYAVYLLGGKENIAECEQIKSSAANLNVQVLAGKLSFLQSAALMRTAAMNYVNDSAPLHFASAVNAPVTAVFCSTVPAFGFTPLSDKSFVIEITENLNCRPCGLHGHKACPQQHFKCALTIQTNRLIETLEK